MSLRIVLHREIPEHPKLHHQWNDLALQMERPEVFFTYEWALAAQSAYRASLSRHEENSPGYCLLSRIVIEKPVTWMK